MIMPGPKSNSSNAPSFTSEDSAGGWLARATMVENGPEWAADNVLALATLGTPHAAPPEGIPDMTRGVLRNLEASAPGAALAGGSAPWGAAGNGSGRNVAYVTVAGDAVTGDAEAPRSAPEAIAYGSYKMVCGRGDGVAGDGVVPVCSAHLGPERLGGGGGGGGAGGGAGAAGARLGLFPRGISNLGSSVGASRVPSPSPSLQRASVQLTLRGVAHSINEVGTVQPTDQWYGAEPVVDQWLPALLEATRSAVRARKFQAQLQAAAAAAPFLSGNRV